MHSLPQYIPYHYSYSSSLLWANKSRADDTAAAQQVFFPPHDLRSLKKPVNPQAQALGFTALLSSSWPHQQVSYFLPELLPAAP